jgi:hypothetical protein
MVVMVGTVVVEEDNLSDPPAQKPSGTIGTLDNVGRA